MSPPSPPDALSLSDSLDAALKVCPISKGIKNPSEWAEKAQDPPSSSATGQALARGPLASICIVAACTSSLMITSGMCSAVTISLPYVGKDLDIQEDDLQWILSSYSISSACFLLLCGRLADLHGRKLVWLIGYSITGICGLCAACFAQSGIALDIMRGIEGIGAAAMIPASLGILSRAFPPGPSRSIAFATFSAGAPIGSAFSTVLSSVLTQLTGPTWRSPLYLLSGFTFACLILGFFAIDEDEPSTEEDRRVDWIGATLITSGLMLIVFVLNNTPASREGWRAPHIVGLFVFGIILVLLFVVWQYYLERRLENTDLPRTRWTAPPLMKPSMWTHARGRFAVMQIIACINCAAFSCWLVWVQLYYQAYLNLTPIHTMLRILPMFFMGVVANIIIALIIGHVDVVYIVAVGTLLTTCANIYFAVIDPSAPYWALGFPSACLIVLGVDFTFASGTMFISKVSPQSEQSVSGALFQAMTQIGSAIGPSVSTIVFNGVLRAQSSRLGASADHGGDDAPLVPQLKAYQAAMWTGFAFGVLSTVLCVFLRGVGVVGEKPAQDMAMDLEDHDSRGKKGT
ncbi:efflux transporter [Russula compacta]|nr:efflux transporter [Russula compacta]